MEILYCILVPLYRVLAGGQRSRGMVGESSAKGSICPDK